MAKILIIEDDEFIAEQIRTWLLTEKHVVDIAGNGSDGIYMLQHYDYELAIVDWNLPDIEGIEICSRIRQLKPEIPLLMLTSRASTAEKITGLDAGAMDYVVKPCALPELSARIRALLRRPYEVKDSMVFADLELNPHTREACTKGAKMKLSALEFDIMMALLKQKDSPMDFPQLAYSIGKDYDSSVHGVIKQYILVLRRKLQQSESRVTIKYERDRGYSIVEQTS